MRLKQKLYIPVIAAIALLIITGCQTVGSQPRTPLDDAKIAYIDASFAFEGAQQAMKIAAEHGQVTMEQARKFDEFQRKVNATSPIIGASLRSWNSTGTKPATWDDELTAFLNAVAQATAQVPKK